MSELTWPKREDGTNKTMGEMTSEERKQCWQRAAETVKKELEQPEVQEQLKKILE